MLLAKSRAWRILDDNVKKKKRGGGKFFFILRVGWILFNLG